VRSKKKFIVLGISLICVALFSVISLFYLSDNEKKALHCVEDLQNNLKSPDSLTLSEIRTVQEESNIYTYITYSAINSYGAKIKSIAMYKNGQYLGEHDSDVWYASFEETNEIARKKGSAYVLANSIIRLEGVTINVEKIKLRLLFQK